MIILGVLFLFYISLRAYKVYKTRLDNAKKVKLEKLKEFEDSPVKSFEA